MENNTEYILKTIINKNFKPIRFRIKGKPHYQIFMEIESETDPNLDNVKRVEYLLHPTFKRRERTNENRSSNFRIEIKAWGTFVVGVTLYKTDDTIEEFKQHMKTHWLEDYL